MSKKSLWVISSFVFSIVCLVSASALKNPYYFDDHVVIEKNGWLMRSSPPLEVFGRFYVDDHQLFSGYRPVLMLSFWASSKAIGNSAASHRSVNIALHSLNAALVFFLLCSLSKVDKAQVRWSLFSALLFALHPVQTLAINMIWKRSSVLEMTWMLLGLLWTARWNSSGRRSKAKDFLLHLPLLALALGTKESAVVYPLFLFAVDWITGGKKAWRTLVDRKWLYGTLSVGCLVFYWFRTHYISMHDSTAPMDPARALSIGQYLVASMHVIPQYFLDWIYPEPYMIDDPSIPLGPLWLGILQTGGLAALSVLLLIRFRKSAWIFLAMSFFWIGLLPTSSIQPLFFVKDQIRMYAPILGLSMLLSRAFSNMARVLWILVLFYGAFSFVQNRYDRNPISAWTDVVEKYPRSVIAHNELGASFSEAKDFASAANEYEISLRLKPNNPGALVRKIFAQFRMEGYTQTVRSQVMSAQNLEVLGLDALNLAILEIEFGFYERAKRRLLELNTTQPNLPMVFFLLGFVFEKEKNRAMAEAYYRQTLKLDPTHRDAAAAVSRLQGTQ